MRVLVVEDERLLADAIATGLRRYAIAVDVVYDGAAALERATVNDYDVVVLDRDLPRVSGDTVCTTLTEAGRASRILMLTAATAVTDRVAGLRLGADDYLIKPFDIAEFEARVRVLLRRQAGLRSATVSFGGISFDLNSRAFSAGATPLDIPARELGLLEILFMLSLIHI